MNKTAIARAPRVNRFTREKKPSAAAPRHETAVRRYQVDLQELESRLKDKPKETK